MSHGRESLKVIKGAISRVANLLNPEGSLARSEPEGEAYTLPRRVLGESWAVLGAFVGWLPCFSCQSLGFLWGVGRG